MIAKTATANRALIPFRADEIYPDPGIDLFVARDHDEYSEAEHLVWIPVGAWADAESESGEPFAAIQAVLAGLGLRLGAKIPDADVYGTVQEYEVERA